MKLLLCTICKSTKASNKDICLINDKQYILAWTSPNVVQFKTKASWNLKGHSLLWCLKIFVGFFFFGEHKSLLWSHWYPCFGPLVMSALGLKARVDPLAGFLACMILRFASGATPADCIEVSVAAEPSLFDPCTYLQISTSLIRSLLKYFPPC